MTKTTIENEDNKKTEYDKMLAGEMYHASDPELVEMRRSCRLFLMELNTDLTAGALLADPSSHLNNVDIDQEISKHVKSSTDKTKRDSALYLDKSKSPQERFPYFFGHSGKNVTIQPPFFCDYGSNIHLDDDVFLNFNTTILDTCKVSIGKRTLVAPNVHFYSARHGPDPGDFKARQEGLEDGKEIHVGEDCWIGGGVIILPGVRIGNRCVVGAGSVVTRSVEDDSLVVGNPGRVVKKLERES